MSFEQHIQKWITIDNQIKVINDKLKELRNDKHSVFERINTYVETQNLSNTTVKTTDGQLKFVKVKETQPLTFKYLESCLSEIISNDEQVKKIIEYIKNKRESKYIADIKRTYNN